MLLVCQPTEHSRKCRSLEWTFNILYNRESWVRAVPNCVPRFQPLKDAGLTREVSVRGVSSWWMLQVSPPWSAEAFSQEKYKNSHILLSGKDELQMEKQMKEWGVPAEKRFEGETSSGKGPLCTARRQHGKQLCIHVGQIKKINKSEIGHSVKFK